MEWSDDAIVLSLRPHGEHGMIVEALTRSHGRHLGLVHGGASSKRRAMLQPGNRLHAVWRGRLEEQLGTYTVELARARAAEMFAERASLFGLNAFTSISSVALPEREPHEAAYEGADALLEAIADHPFIDWAPLFVRWEIGLLDELGFGLDLKSCAATGETEDLVYVSPRSGRAVSKAAGAAYHEKMLALPAFLLGRGEAGPEDVLAGLRLTSYFLESRVLTPHNKTLPHARARLLELAFTTQDSA